MFIKYFPKLKISEQTQKQSWLRHSSVFPGSVWFLEDSNDVTNDYFSFTNDNNIVNLSTNH